MNSIFLCYREYQEKNRVAIEKMFESVRTFFDIRDVELLIKLDVDDKEALITCRKFIGSKFKIKPIISRRWEGRWSMNYAYEMLFLRIDPTSKYIIFGGDDSYFNRDIRSDLDNNNLILGNYLGELTDKKMSFDCEKENWLIPQYICSYPIIPVEFIKIIGNFGYQVNMDSWFGLLNLIAFKEYGIKIAKHIDEFCIRDNIDRIDDYGIEFNKNLRIDDQNYPTKFLIELAKYQARNIYLNRKGEI